MRAIAMVAGVALMVAACGGKKDATTTTETTPPPAAAAGDGTTHVIEMITTGANSFKFEPENTTIKPGDKVVFKGVSGLAHNVAFYSDSIPPAAAAVLDPQLKDGPQALATNMINDGSQVEVSFAGAPVGTYKFYCIPHLPMGMKGTITVQ